MKTYLKDLTPEEVIRRLKAGEVVRYPDSNLEIKMIDGVLCRFTKHEIVYGTYSTVCTNGTEYSEYYFETPAELKLEVGKCYKTRDGRKAFCFNLNKETKFYLIAIVNDNDTYSVLGNGMLFNNIESPLDLISEWRDDDVAED